MTEGFRLKFPHIFEAWERAGDEVEFERIVAVTQLMMHVGDAAASDRATGVIERFKEAQRLAD